MQERRPPVKVRGLPVSWTYTGGAPQVGFEESSESLATADRTYSAPEVAYGSREGDPSLKALRIPLLVDVGDDNLESVSERSFADEDDALHALLLEGPQPALGKSIQGGGPCPMNLPGGQPNEDEDVIGDQVFGRPDPGSKEPCGRQHVPVGTDELFPGRPFPLEGSGSSPWRLRAAPRVRSLIWIPILAKAPEIRS